MEPQALRHEWFKVPRVDCGQFRLGVDGNGGDDGVQPGAAIRTGAVKNLTGQQGTGFVKGKNAGIQNGFPVPVTLEKAFRKASQAFIASLYPALRGQASPAKSP